MRLNFHYRRRRQKYNVCQIVRHAEIAGTEKHVIFLASYLDKKLFETEVCTFEYGSLVNYLDTKHIERMVIPKSHSILHFLELVRFLRKHKPDIVHSHSGGYSCIAAKLAGCRYIVYTKHGIGFTAQELHKRGFLRKLRDFVVDKCVSYFIALTEYDKQIMVDVLRIKESKVTIIHNGIDPSIVKNAFHKKSKLPTIGVVARLTKQKGLAYLIEAIPLITSKYQNLKVIIAGDGEEKSMLIELAKRLGVLKNIDFLGYVSDPINVINKLDVFVLPSVWEGFPYVLLEAMILKKPIVATDIFGIQEIIDNNKNGILVKPKNPDSISKAVIDLLTDKTKAENLGKAAYKKAIEHYTIEKNVSKIQSLYLHLLRNSRFPVSSI